MKTPDCLRLFALLPILLFAHPARGAVISEIRIDQPQADTDEYFELRGDPGQSLGGLSYVVLGFGLGGSGVVLDVVPLGSHVIPADGHFLVTEASHTEVATADLVTLLNFDTLDSGGNVTHLLVRDFTGALDDDLDLDDDCVLDVQPWAQLLDAVALIVEQNPPLATGCHYGALGATVGPDGSFVPGHVYRCDANWFIGGFTYGTDDTPGTGNVNCPVGSEVASWGTVKARF